jgi:hypothetical protein
MDSAPWLQSGKTGLSQLDYMLGLGSAPQYAPGYSSGTQNGFMGGGAAGQPVAGVAPVQMGGGGQMPAGGPSSGAVAAPGGIQSVAGGVQMAPGGAPAGPSGVNTSLGGFGSLMTPYDKKFVAPTDLTMQNDPGYQARLKLGTDAMQRSAAARGGVLTGGTAQALNQFGQDYASNEYDNVYNRALTGYQTDYNAYNNNQTNQYNRLASLSGLGQQTAAQLGQLGNQTANNVTGNLLSTAQNMGQDYQNAGAANASGYVGAANAWGGALNNIGGSLQNLMLMKQLQGGGGGSYGYGIGPDLINKGYGSNGAMTLGLG